MRFNGATATLGPNNTVSLNAGGYGYGLAARQTCLFQVSVAHAGGLPGFGSLMRWLPEYGVGIVALGNLTYTGWTNVVEEAFQALARTGGLIARQPQPAPALLERQAQVTRLITKWDDELADRIAAVNLFLDIAKARRRTAVEQIVAQAGGECRPEEAIVAENALRGAWRLRCAKSDLRVTMTLAPTHPAAVQFVDVAPLRREDGLGPPPVCR